MTINVEDESRMTLPGVDLEGTARQVIEAALDFEGCPYETEVSLLLTDNEGIRVLNREHRSMDRPTDVLSFPMLHFETPADFSEAETEEADCFNPESGELVLGDIIISLEKVASMCDELLASDPTLLALQNDGEAARRQLSVSRQGWLPDLELGYRRNTESGHPLNGVVVGFSFPIFQNHGKVKMARSQLQSIDYQKENARLSASTALWQLYEEASNLQASIHEYTETFGRQQDLRLLRQALEGGQISMIEYFVEVSVVYQSQTNLLQLENQYQKVMARIYKSKL